MGIFDKVKKAADSTTSAASHALTTASDVAKSASEAVSQGASKAAVVTGKAITSDTVANIIDVTVDAAAGVVFDPVQSMVNRAGVVAKIIPSEGLKVTHEITSEVVNGTHELLTDAAKDGLKKVLTSSGEKLIEIGGPEGIPPA